MQLPESQPKAFASLLISINEGQIKIPQFQREFVWTMQKSAGLIDSIIKGYPIGTFIFWRTKERLRSVKDIGGQLLPEPEEGESVDYVLDGQQRLTSLFASLEGVKLKRASGQEDDFSEIFIDLEAEETDLIVITDAGQKDTRTLINIYNLLKGDFKLLGSYPEKYHQKIGTYKSRIESYQYPIVQIKGASIDTATEIFTRINVGGKPLSIFQIMVAKTFDHEKDFDLVEKTEALLDNLRIVDYETISESTILQTMSVILSKECTKKAILQIEKRDFVDKWDAAKDAIERAVEYFKSYYRIPVSQLLPYNALVVPFSYFFYHHPDKPTGSKQKFLEDFFWRCALSGRYSASLESKIAQDIKKIDEILHDKLPSYEWPIDTSEEFIKSNGSFTASRSYIKAILCVYAYVQPKSFNDGSIVNISNSWLKQANSKNYHHFFPKSYLKGKNYENSRINHILNITIVDDFLNKREIGAKPPSKYMTKFKNENESLQLIMSTHLIGNLDEFGIWNDDYDKFFDERAKVVSRELSKRIMKQDVDNREQLNLINDFEQDSSVIE